MVERSEDRTSQAANQMDIVANTKALSFVMSSSVGRRSWRGAVKGMLTTVSARTTRT